MRLLVVLISFSALGIACVHQASDPANPNGGVTLTSGTYDSPPPPATASPGPTDYMAPQASQANGEAAPSSRKLDDSAHPLSTWGGGASTDGGTKP